MNSLDDPWLWILHQNYHLSPWDEKANHSQSVGFFFFFLYKCVFVLAFMPVTNLLMPERTRIDSYVLGKNMLIKKQLRRKESFKDEKRNLIANTEYHKLYHSMRKHSVVASSVLQLWPQFTQSKSLSKV